MENKSIPGWYWVIVGLLLIWYIIIIILLTGQVNLTKDAFDMMTPNEKQFYIDMPAWVLWASALGGFGGAIGCIALFARRTWAKSFLIASLIGIIAQIIYYIAMGGGLQVYNGIAIIIPLLKISIAIYAVWLSVIAIRRGWLHT